MSKQEFRVFCTRMNRRTYTKGIQVFCVKCGEKIWLSDSTIIGIKNRHGIKSFDEDQSLFPYCEEHIDDPDLDGKLMPLTKEQVEEINKTL